MKKKLFLLSIISIFLHGMEPDISPLPELPSETQEQIFEYRYIPGLLKELQNITRLDQAVTLLRKKETSRILYDLLIQPRIMDTILQLLEQKFKKGKIPIAFALQTSGARNWLNKKFKTINLKFSQLAQFYRQIHLNLEKAIQDNDKERVQYWLARGADPNSKVGIGVNRSVSILYAKGGNPEIVELLLEAGMMKINKGYFRVILVVPATEQAARNRKRILDLVEKSQKP